MTLESNQQQQLQQSKMTTPMATTPVTTVTGFSHQSRGVRRQWTHSPVVMAMLTNNRMTNCRDVSAMVAECQASGSDDQVCRTAASYFDVCMNEKAHHL